MRIALLTHQWPGIRMGGIGAAVRQTAAALAAIGHEVHVFTFCIPPELRAQIPPGVHLHETADLATRVQQGNLLPGLAATLNAGGEGAYRLALGWLLCAAVLEVHRQTPFDVLETPEVEALGLPLMLDTSFNAPVITHLHCCTALANRANKTRAEPSQSLTTALEFAAIHLADAICAPSQAVVRETQTFLPIRQAATIIPHPYQCPEKHFTPPDDKGPMLFIGRIERLKGAELIGRALNTFLPRHPRAIFRFIGPDTPTAPSARSMREHIRAMIAPEIASQVEFAGEMSQAEIEIELHHCSFCVQPSYWENFSMTCCEAFAAGRTVIVGEGTGSVELAGDACLAVDTSSSDDLAAAMELLWSDRALLARLSKRAHDRIRGAFSPAEMAERRAEFYRDAIAKFRENPRTNLPANLSTLPPCATAALLPALSSIIGSLAGVYHPPQTPGARLLKIMNDLSSQSGQPAKVLLYGAGKHTARLLAERHIWESKGHQVVGLLDDHERFAADATYLSLPVQSLRAATCRLNAGEHLPPVVLSTDTYQDQFWAQTTPMRAQGVAVFRLY
jgi:glycosyltransferase involved in cell wall biosynthesis